jgi:hypothetical protein
MDDWMNAAILPVPEWMLPKRNSAGRPRDSNPLGEFELTDVAAMLKVIPSDDRDLWRAVGIILGRLFKGSDAAWQLYQEWSDTWGGTKGRDHDKTMRECFYEISQEETDKSLGIGTIIHYAKLHGWVPPLDPRPQLNAGIGDLHRITTRAWDVVGRETDEPHLFLYGRFPARIEPDPTGALRIVELTPDRLRHHAAAMGRWIKSGKTGPVSCRPPMDVVKNMLAMPDIPLPVLTRIVTVPVFTSSGVLVQTPGYDHVAKIYYQPYDPAAMAEVKVPMNPMKADVNAAKAAIDALIAEFPFVSDADRTHAVALCLLPIVRDLIEGPTPLHMVEASTPGTGKNLLTEVMLYPGLGAIEATTEAREDEEWRKRLTSYLREGRPIMLIDNVSRVLDSASLAAALTARAWSDRLLSVNETVSVPVRMLFVATANNPTLSIEMIRRTVRCRLDAKMPKPWERTSWEIPNLREYAHSHRPALIGALLTLTQAWVRAGRPGPGRNVKVPGSFEDWCAVVGGIVTFAGYKDFLANAAAMYDEVNTEAAVWLHFVTRWWDLYRDRIVTVRDHLFALAKEIDDFPMGKATTESGQRAVMGQVLSKHRDQVFGDYTIVKVPNASGTAAWQLKSMNKPETEHAGKTAF